MKTNLKTFPKEGSYHKDYDGWKEDFEAELREQIKHLEKQDQDHAIPLAFIAIRLREILGEDSE